MKEKRKTLLLAILISGIIIASFDAIGLYTIWSAQQDLLQQTTEEGAIGGGPQEIFDAWIQSEFLIIVKGVAMWSIVWVVFLTAILYFVIDWIKKRKEKSQD